MAWVSLLTTQILGGELGTSSAFLVKRHNKHDNQTNSRYAVMHARSIIPHQVIGNN